MHIPRKRFGQNFLIDRNIIERIIGAIAPEPTQHLVEIGPGQGALTQFLVPSAKRLDLIEIDRDLAASLEHQYHHQKHVQLYVGDALRFDFSQLGSDLRLIGNLPYNISTPLLIQLLDYYTHIQDAHFMLQKEVVARICAPPGNKTYGRLSVVMQYYFNVELLFLVPPGAFSPAPKVQSAIVRLSKKSVKKQASSLKIFHQLCRIAFAQRRKTLRNNLKQAFASSVVADLEALIDLSRRPETLCLDEYIGLSNRIALLLESQ